MKILFTADWHIKQGQRNVPKDWQRDRFVQMYESISEIVKEHKIDTHIIGGDIFDRVPSLEELALFLEYFTKSMDCNTIIFDGNHEATKKGHTFFRNLKGHLEGFELCTVISEPTTIENMDIIPYTHLKTFNPDDFSGNLLFTHVRGAIEPHVKPEIDLTLLDRWDIVFAGDLHSHTNCQRNIVYPGSPVNTTFTRSKPQNGYLIIDSETADWSWHSFDLPALLKKAVDSEDDMVETKYDHTVYELVGDIDTLAKVEKSNPLLDKKVTNRTVESEIDFSSADSILEELDLYLVEVLKLDNKEKIMGVYNDHIQAT